MTTTLALGCFGLAVLLFQEWLRRSRPLVGWLLFGMLPLLLTPWWIAVNYHAEFYRHAPLFPIVKLYSMMFVCLVLTALRYTRLQRHPRALALPYWLMVVNLAEALLLDVYLGGTTHWISAVAAGLLILALPMQPCRITSVPYRPCDLEWPATSRGWIVGYTLWNVAFAYLNFPPIAGQQAILLTVALVIGLGRPERWLQARCYTFASYLLFLFAFPTFCLDWLDTAAWSRRELDLPVALLGLVVPAVLVASTCFAAAADRLQTAVARCRRSSTAAHSGVAGGRSTTIAATPAASNSCSVA